METRDRAKQIFYSAVTLVTCLILVEGLLRIKNRYPTVVPFTPTPEGLLVKEKNIDTQLRSENGMVVHVTTNDLGFAGPTVATSTSSTLVAFLGDSFTQALQVDDDKKFTALIEHSLKKEKNNVQVLNFAQDGGTMVEDMLVYREYIAKLHPRFVVLVVSDHLYDTVDIGQADVIRSTPISELSAEQLLGNKFDRYQSTRTALNDFFRHFEILRYLLQLRRTHIHVGAMHEIPARILSAITYNPFVHPKKEPVSPELQSQVGLVVDEIGKFNAFVKDSGGELVLVIMPHSTEVGVPPTYGNQLIFQTFCSDVPVIDLTPAFSVVAKKNIAQLYMNDTGHLTEAGHELVAEKVISFLSHLLDKKVPFLGVDTSCPKE